MQQYATRPMRRNLHTSRTCCSEQVKNSHGHKRKGLLVCMRMAYLSRPDYGSRFRRGVGKAVKRILCVDNRAEGEAQLAADDLRVQCELLRVAARLADADAAPDAIPEEFYGAKMDVVTGGRGGSHAA